MTTGGNRVPSITNAEHIGPADTGDNIEAKRVALYMWDGTNWQRFPVNGGGYLGSTTRANVSDQNTTITASTSATTIVSAVAATYCDLLSLVLTNTSATGTEVQLFNDDGTTIRNVFYVPANDTRGIVFSVPFTQAAVNVTWKLKTVTSITSLKITAQFAKNT
jgi:hypothetical protein